MNIGVIDLQARVELAGRIPKRCSPDDIPVYAGVRSGGRGHRAGPGRSDGRFWKYPSLVSTC